jgi:hypothetical protein
VPRVTAHFCVFVVVSERVAAAALLHPPRAHAFPCGRPPPPHAAANAVLGLLLSLPQQTDRALPANPSPFLQ